MNEKIIVSGDDGKWYLIPFFSAIEFNNWIHYMDVDEEWEGTDFDSMRIDHRYEWC